VDKISGLQARLESKANPKTKAWWEGYLKGAIPFRGVKMGDIRSALHTWLREESIPTELSPAENMELALQLLQEIHCEDKLAGILYLQEVLIPSGALDWRRDLARFADLFQDGYIYDWNTCDWFCVKVLGPLAELEGQPCARAISAWSNSENLWQRRAAGVAFVNLAKKGEAYFPGFSEMLLETCAALLQSQERFSQTGAGWVLRELSLAEPQRVAAFIQAQLQNLSREALLKAIPKLPEETRKRLKKEANSA
jgi:3-methyladenine DNA glycosylase AlkD